MRLILLFLLSTMFIFSIDFDTLENIKNQKNSTSVTLANFNTKKAQKITSQEKSKNSWLGKKTVEFVKEVAQAGASSSVVTSTGSHTYQCSYHCKTDGLSSNATDTVRINIKANTRYEAEDKLGKISKKHCRSLYAEGTFGKKWMWATSKRCE